MDLGKTKNEKDCASLVLHTVSGAVGANFQPDGNCMATFGIEIHYSSDQRSCLFDGIYIKFLFF